MSIFQYILDQTKSIDLALKAVALSKVDEWVTKWTHTEGNYSRWLEFHWTKGYPCLWFCSNYHVATFYILTNPSKKLSGMDVYTL